ncbi:hypothetical protein [Persephonella sp.]
MKKLFVLTVGLFVFFGCGGKQQETFHEYNPLMEEYERIFNDKETKNVYVGGLLGGSGKTITATFPEIISIAVKEAAIEKKAIQYNCKKCPDNYLKVLAVPEKWEENCVIIQVNLMRREEVLKEESYRVCRKRK